MNPFNYFYVKSNLYKDDLFEEYDIEISDNYVKVKTQNDTIVYKREDKKKENVKFEIGDVVKIKNQIGFKFYKVKDVEDWLKSNKVPIDQIFAALNTEYNVNIAKQEKFSILYLNRFKDSNVAFVSTYNGKYAFVIDLNELELVKKHD